MENILRDEQAERPGDTPGDLFITLKLGVHQDHLKGLLKKKKNTQIAEQFSRAELRNKNLH